MKAEADEEAPRNNIMLMSGKALLQEVEKGEEMHFSIVGRPKVILTSTNLEDLPKYFWNMLNDFANIIVDEFPNVLLPIRSIIHHIDLVPGALLLNKAAYRLTSQENVEVGRQLQ